MSGPPPPASIAADVRRHLERWIGGWPPELPVNVVPNPDVSRPGWDGRPRRATGAVDPDGRAVIGVDPAVAAALPPSIDGVEMLRRAMPGAIGRAGVLGLGVLRWAHDVPDTDELADIGVWLPAELANDHDDPRVDEWLAPFGGDVLVALDDDGHYLGGVGLKRHDDLGRELSVVTAEAAPRTRPRPPPRRPGSASGAGRRPGRDVPPRARQRGVRSCRTRQVASPTRVGR